MYQLVISTHGDDEQVQRRALDAAVRAVEAVNDAPVYRAYLEKIEGGQIIGVPNAGYVIEAEEAAR